MSCREPEDTESNHEQCQHQAMQASSPDPIRGKLAYLLDPQASSGNPTASLTPPHRRDLSSVNVAEPSQASDCRGLAPKMRDVEAMVSGAAKPSGCSEPSTDAEILDTGVLGITSKHCSACGAAEASLDRVFVELGKLYCSSCWSSWERCGWWKPSIRVSTTPPLVDAGGLPKYGAEDAFFLPAFLCPHDDLSLFEKLKSELPVGCDFSDWHGGRHLGLQFEGEGARHDGEAAPCHLAATVARMEAAFGIRASASRLNLYRSDRDYKPLHCDRGRDEAGTPQVTVGASFGATRELTLVHRQSGVSMTFPQGNGDVFAFTPELNTVFMHGVPKIGYGSPSESEGRGPRLSLILWGSKVSQHEHGNSGTKASAAYQECSSAVEELPE